MIFLKTTLLMLCVSPVFAEPMSYSNLPLGTQEKPLILSTYLPDPGLDSAYFAHHGKGGDSPKYDVGKGVDAKGEFKTIKGFPAALGVNHGPALSYVFDTVECRIAYAWQGGFLDMYPYWGDPVRGNRQSYDYIPRLVGSLFYVAPPMSEVFVNGKRLTELENPKFIGYDLKNGIPTFLFSRGGHHFKLTVTPETKASLSFAFTLSSPDKISLSYGTADSDKLVNALTHTVTGKEIANFNGYPRDMNMKEATIANGQLLFDSLGCSACHSIDSSLGHGPTLAGLFGSERSIQGMKDKVKADAAYILESIKTPSAKAVEGFPPNYMPPYALKDLEYQSLVLFIESIAGGK